MPAILTFTDTTPLAQSPQQAGQQLTGAPDASDAPYAAKVARDLVEKTSLDLLKSGLGRNPKSTVLSPVSISPVLGMLLAAMDNQTSKEELLGLPPKSLTKELETQIHRELGAFSRAHPFTEKSAVATVNFLTSLRPITSLAFIDALLRTYDAEARIVDSDVAKTTNEYVAHRTAGRITNVFGDASKEERDNVILALGNVLNFQGFWENSFDKSDTSAGQFYCLDGSIINNVQMMHQRDDLSFSDYAGFEAMAKPFDSDDGKPLKLVVIKPCNRTSSLPNLSSGLINELIDASTKADKQAGYLTLPRIQIEHTDRKLLDSLASATGRGIRASDLGNLNLWPIDQLNSQSTISVSMDEAGASGSVSTVAYIGRSGEMPRQFTLDRPGYFAIVDDSGNRLVEALITDGQFLATDGPASITPPSKPSKPSKHSGNGNVLPRDISPLNGLQGEKKTVVSEKRYEYTMHPLLRYLLDREFHVSEGYSVSVKPPVTHGPTSTTPSSGPSGGIDALPNGNSPMEGSLEVSKSVTSKESSSPLVSEGLLARVQNTLNPDGQLNITRVYDSAGRFRIEVKSCGVAETLQTKILQLIGHQEPEDFRLIEFFPGSVDLIVKNNARKELLNIFGEA